MVELLETAHEPTIAAHLVTQRTFYTHHGIYIGNGRVIHYAGLASGWWRGPVEEISLAEFARGGAIRVRHSGRSFDSREVVARARSRLGERDYRILTNNCEHFCAWALRAETVSDQVDRWLRLPRRLADALRTWLEGTPRGATEDSAYHPG